ncbi:hypothetical protein Ancab_031295 [Ancistrocladus abbreviatus]
MACGAIHSWTFSGLVGAFLDLAITYLLLCCSTIAFFVSKFLAFFGLTLPCTCNGRFGTSNSNPGPCWQTFLVNCPPDKISAVQFSIKSKFPFDSIWARNEDAHFNLKLIREINLDDGGAEASVSSLSDAKRTDSISGGDTVWKTEFQEGRFGAKGMGTVSQRTKSGFRRRRRGNVSRGNFASISSLERVRSDRVVSWSTSSMDRIGNAFTAENSMAFDSNDVRETSLVEVNKSMDKNSLSSEDHRSTAGSSVGVDSQGENAIRILEQALKEEQAARATLCCELEEERIAAATAADETMAMILRLQEEKASIELEARQYQRILEEKSAYDAEEMDILKEIIIRREQEKHFLEKEVEAFRRMLMENGQFEGKMHVNVDAEGPNISSLLDSSEDRMQMLQQLSEYIDKSGKVQCIYKSPDNASATVEKQNYTVHPGTELSIPDRGDRSACVRQKVDHRYLIEQNQLHCDQEFQEKVIVSKDGIRFAQQEETERMIISVRERGQDDEADLSQDMALEAVKRNDGSGMHIGNADNDTEIQAGEKSLQNLKPCGTLFDAEPKIYDVHVIDDKCEIYGKDSVKKGDPLLMHDDRSYVVRKCEVAFEASDIEGASSVSSCATTTNPDMEAGIKRNSSVTRPALPPLSTQSKPSRSELERNSVDYERLKIENEVGWLRERLRTVQKGREKLNISMDYREREKSQFRLLEDIANHLREIRQLTKPNNAMRQASLPPPSSKATSKKRRCRSASIGQSLSS